MASLLSRPEKLVCVKHYRNAVEYTAHMPRMIAAGFTLGNWERSGESIRQEYVPAPNTEGERNGR